MYVVGRSFLFARSAVVEAAERLMPILPWRRSWRLRKCVEFMAHVVLEDGL
jgi:hypothetical protein